MSDRDKAQYIKKRKRMMEDHEYYLRELERRRKKYWLENGKTPEEAEALSKRREEKVDAGIREQLHPPLHGETMAETIRRYNLKAEKAIKEAERDRKEKWGGLHRYEAAMKFIREGMSDDEIIERIGLYKDYEDGTKHPDYKLLRVYKNVAAGRISEGHDVMPGEVWRWINGFTDGAENSDGLGGESGEDKISDGSDCRSDGSA